MNLGNKLLSSCMIKRLINRTSLVTNTRNRMFSTSKETSDIFDIRAMQREGRSIYLDVGATTQMDFRVLDKMMPYLTSQYGNPHSRNHMFGWEAEKAIETARGHVADIIKANPKEIVFTSGATESNNLAIKGLAKFYGSKTKNHFITTQIDHKCVLDTLRNLDSDGYETDYLKVNQQGYVDLEDLEKRITPKTIAVSIIAVHNEIGVIQNIKEIGKICKKHKVFFHTDAAQAFGKIPMDAKDWNIDLMSISGHKIYGPKGVGALYVSRKPRVRLQPLINGGGQERGLRSGTLAPPLIVGFGEACRLAKLDMSNDRDYIQKLSEKFHQGLLDVPHVQVNGDLKNGYPGIFNISFEYVEGESLLMALRNLALSSGSACTSASLEPSYVLRALGKTEELAHTSIRFGIGRFTTESEVEFAIELIKDRVHRLRQMSPFFDESDEEDSVEWVGGGR